MAWLLARTLAQQEYHIRDRLIASSVGAYVPSRRLLVYPRHTRKPRAVRYPLFSRYLFIWVDDVWVDITIIRNVSMNIWIARNQENELVYVKDKDIDALALREAGGEFDQRHEGEDIKFVVGDNVLVKSGPFADLRGVVDQFIHPKRKCRVALPNCSLEVGIDLLELAV
jgi:transcription antitermination factor NusG